jgi:flagellar biosynthesis protein FlhB
MYDPSILVCLHHHHCFSPSILEIIFFFSFSFFFIEKSIPEILNLPIEIRLKIGEITLSPHTIIIFVMFLIMFLNLPFELQCPYSVQLFC